MKEQGWLDPPFYFHVQMLLWFLTFLLTNNIKILTSVSFPELLLGSRIIIAGRNPRKGQDIEIGHLSMGF